VILRVQTQLSTDLSTSIVDNAVAPEPASAVVRVAIDMPRHGLFDYLPPAGIRCEQLRIGARVRVPMGTRECVGVVVDHAERSALAPGSLKPIHELIDPEPLFDASLMRLLLWSAQYYHHPLGEVIAAALPKALRQGAAATAQVELWRLSRAGADADATASLGHAPAQRAVMALLAVSPQGLPAGELAARLPSWRAAARSLQARGFIERLQVHAPGSASGAAAPAGGAGFDPPPVLTAAQEQAVTRIDAASGSYAAFVLQGATGSGKSEVYLQCAARALQRGQSALVLVPEIALTPQLIERFRRRLPCAMAVLHSGLSDAERLAAWRDARCNRARIVLGTRSAVFAPLPQLGLIVVDEEHDSSYKQHESGCRYSARDLAVVRAQQAQVPVVLGSATPAFETLHNLRSGRYHGLSLPRRADQPEAPRLALIDVRAHTVTQGLSTPVLDAMRRHLAARGQVLVFINRRGYAPTLLCTACGWMAPCSQCDARLTVHRSAGELRCHYCGAVEALPQRCLRCGFAVKPVGQGTERVEETLTQMFPEEALIRLDRDSASNPAELEALMSAVLSGQARILVGTQIVTKGHHFPGISLVVVLNADQGLFSTDFRAAERLAQTIVQVAGRAGREHSRGEVLIQTEYPEHPLLQSLLAGGYEGFAGSALAERAAAQWPPFARLAILRASALTADAALEFLSAARAAAPAISGVRLLGPVAAAMARRAGRFYAQLLLESPERGALHKLLDQWLPAIAGLPQARRVRFALDVDPIDIQ
jgi:primosomal protein N' (replication factor Y) (superfamily II helicase)